MSIGNFFSPGYGYSTGFPMKLIGASYEREIIKKLYIGAGYMQWLFPNSISKGYPGAYKIDAYNNPLVPVGTLDTRHKYKMGDLYLLYEGINIKKHSLKVGVGAFYGSGVNSYLTWAVINPYPPYDAQMDYEHLTETFWGVAPVFRYDYSLLNGRVTASAFYRYRHYMTEDFVQNDLCIQVGLRF